MLYLSETESIDFEGHKAPFIKVTSLKCPTFLLSISKFFKSGSIQMILEFGNLFLKKRVLRPMFAPPSMIIFGTKGILKLYSSSIKISIKVGMSEDFGLK